MHAISRLCLSLCLLLTVSVTAWEIDTVSPGTFTPLKVGNEWVYYDTSWPVVCNSGCTSFASDSLERRLKITGTFFSGDTLCWVADVDVRGVRSIYDSDGSCRKESRDTIFSDTLSMPPNGFFAPGSYTTIFSWGMVALFPWFGFEEPCTSMSDFGIVTINRLFQENFGDTVMKVTGSSRTLYLGDSTSEMCEIMALASVGMVYGLRQQQTLGNNVYHTRIRLRSFNGETIDPAQYAASNSRPPTMRSLPGFPGGYIHHVRFVSDPEMQKIEYNLMGRKVIGMKNAATTLLLGKRRK